MSSTWYENTSEWYAPRETAPAKAPELSVPEKKTKKGWTPLRISGAVFLLLALIVASSLLFGGLGKEAPTLDLPAQTYESTDDLPSDPAQFFKNFYQSTTTDVTDINIERAELPIDFTMELTPAAGEELSLQELYEKCSKSIVAISAYENTSIGYSWGTGVILSADGLILTNTHVINGCDRAVVTLPDDREFEALLVGADTISDVALLKIDAKGLPVVELGESATLRVGDHVAAIGNPLGETFRNTLTDGIISAIERGVQYNGRSMTLLQTNTAINEGNSGGALFNLQGQVIGITNMKMMSSFSSIEGIGFAIPSTTVCTVVNALVRDGEVKGRPSIGITVGAIPQTAKEAYSLPDGLYVTDVSEGSDAKTKGVQAGDVITAVNGTPVTTTAEISDIKNALEVGDTMILTIWRDGETLEIPVLLVDTNDIYN
jgi:serine protease Do